MQVILEAGGSPYHLVYAGTQGRDQGSVVNFDDTNTIIAGPTQGDVQNNTPLCYQIGPLNSVTVDGGHDVWVIAQAGQPAVEFMQGVTNWSPSPAQAAIQISTLGLATEATQQQVEGNTSATAGSTAATAGNTAATTTAVGVVTSTLGSPAQDPTVAGLNPGIPNSIAVTGAPLLALAQQWIQTGTLTYASGQSRTFGPISLNQISYEGIVTAVQNASDTLPSFSVLLQWLDSSGNEVNREQWYMSGGTGVGNTFSGSGRAKGAKLQVTVTNDGTLSGTFNLLLYQTSRVYVKDDWHTTVHTNVPGYTNPNRDPAANILATMAPTLASGVAAIRSVPLYCGTVRISGFTQTGTAAFAITAIDNTNLGSSNAIWQTQVASNSQFNQQFDLPRYQCIITATNTGSGSQQLELTIVVSEQNI